MVGGDPSHASLYTAPLAGPTASSGSHGRPCASSSTRGRCLQGLALANLAERRGDLAAASEHLDAAGELFAWYGAKRYLDQMLARKQILKASAR